MIIIWTLRLLYFFFLHWSFYESIWKFGVSLIFYLKNVDILYRRYTTSLESMQQNGKKNESNRTRDFSGTWLDGTAP